MQRIKVLPVFPEFPPSFWSYRYGVKMLGKKATMPPTGLATVAAMLPEEHFDLQRIVDMNVEPLRDEQLREADIIFTSSMIVQRKSNEEIIERAHKFGKKVVSGGPYPTSYHEQVSADYLVLGEAEVTLAPFLNDFLGGKARRIYTEKNVERDLTQLTKGGKPIVTNTPIPRWDLLNLNNYYSMAVQYSRGCPFDCEFCDITALFGRESRTKTPEQMVREFDALYQADWRGAIFLVDDNFIGNAPNVRKLLPALEEWQKKNGYPFSFLTEASVNLGNRNFSDILNGMVKAGFDHVFLGIESPDPDVLKKMDKGQNLGDLEEKVRNIQKAGLEVTGGFIIGADGEKEGAAERLFDFVQSNGIVVPMPGLLTALKDTKLYKRLEKEGRLRGDSSGNHTHSLGFNFVPEREEQTLIGEYKTLLGKLFDSKNYFERCRTLNERRGDFHKMSVTKADVKAFFNIVYEKVIRHPDREFTKYLLETAVHSPSIFPVAVAQGVKLHHFQTMTKATLAVEEYKGHVDTLYERFQERVADMKKETHDFFDRVSAAEKEIVSEARRKYGKIHSDFRAGARGAYKNLLQRVSQYKEQLAGVQSAV